MKAKNNDENENKEKIVEEVEPEKVESTVNLESNKKSNNKENKKDSSKKENTKADNKPNGKNDNSENIKKEKKKKSFFKISIILAFIILMLGALSTGFALLNHNNTKIMLGVKIQNINMQGLNKDQATQIILGELNTKLEEKIILKADSFEYSITPSQIEANFNIDQAVEKAYNIGRGKNVFVNNFEILYSMIFGQNIEAELTYNENLLSKDISDITVKLPDALIQTGYYIEEDKLIITKGTEGNGIDEEKVKELILNQIKAGTNNEIFLSIMQLKPQAIDIEKIYSEVCRQPQNAYYTKDPFQIFPQINGIDFDLVKAKEILTEDKKEYEIPLTITIPEITTNDLGTEAFPDLLSSFTTKYDATNKSRSNNLQLAANKINGFVLAPGEIFSYNKVLGERTIAKGYKEAPGYVGGKVVPTLGGGICQISTTLYDTVLYANLKIIERKNHMFTSSYVGIGRDATVSYGTIDFKFQNTRKYPIIIKASVQNGIAKIDIYGIKEEIEYEIELSTTTLYVIPYKTVYEDDNTLAPGEESVEQYGKNGCKAVTYKITKLNGTQISKEILSTDTYDPMNKIVKRGPTPETIAPVETTQPEIIILEEDPPEPVNITPTNNIIDPETNTNSSEEDTNTNTEG